VVLIQILE